MNSFNLIHCITCTYALLRTNLLIELLLHSYDTLTAFKKTIRELLKSWKKVHSHLKTHQKVSEEYTFSFHYNDSICI